MDTQIEKNHEEERKSTIICEIYELQGFFVSGLVLGFLDQDRSQKDPSTHTQNCQKVA